MHWKIKALAQAVLSVAPFGERIYLVLQERFGGLRSFSLWTRHEALMRLLSEIRGHYTDLSQLCVVEIGTGWIPIVPLGFSLVGMEKIHTYDIRRLISPSLIQPILPQYSQIVDMLSAYASDGKEGVQSRYQAMCNSYTTGDLETFLQSMHIVYSAPADAAQTCLQEESIDLVISVNTLEHIDPSTLGDIFAEARRILKHHGTMIHLIDLTDHFAHPPSSSITHVNFLKYSDLAWQLIGSNKFNYHNRLRPPDFVRLVQAAGFTIVSQDVVVNELSLEALKSMRLAPRFRHYSDVDLATSGLLMAAQK